MRHFIWLLSNTRFFFDVFSWCDSFRHCRFLSSLNVSVSSFTLWRTCRDRANERASERLQKEGALLCARALRLSNEFKLKCVLGHTFWVYGAKKSCWLQLHEYMMGLNCCRRPDKKKEQSHKLKFFKSHRRRRRRVRCFYDGYCLFHCAIAVRCLVAIMIKHTHTHTSMCSPCVCVCFSWKWTLCTSCPF